MQHKRCDVPRTLPLLAALALAGSLLLGGCVGDRSAPPAAPPPRSEAPTVALPATQPPSAEATPAITPTPTPQPTPEPPAEKPLGIVVIDAGHQGKANPTLEPIGPGASERKPKVATGTRGVVTRTPESVLNLQISRRLGRELEARGVQVIQVRTSEDVNIANSERSAIANEANADLFIRIHADGGPRENRGISVLVPGKNEWTGPIVAESGKAGRAVHNWLIAKTGANDRGVVPRSDLSGFNWSKVPTILVEVGFMTNPAEDRMLARASYQQKLAEGMADGVVEYLESGR